MIYINYIFYSLLIYYNWHIIIGALLCEMRLTVKGILLNMMYLVKKYGCVLNGSRVYYEKRSQPPLLIHMAYAYSISGSRDDNKFVLNNIKV